MAGINDEKFKQMQDEMSRFEEEIGLPIPDRPKVIGTSTYSEVEKTLAGEAPRPVPLPNGLPPPPPALIPPPPRPPRPPVDLTHPPLEPPLPPFPAPMFRGPMPSVPPMPPVPPGPMPPVPPAPMQGPIPPDFFPVEGMPPPPPGMGFGPMMTPPMMAPMPPAFSPAFPPQMMPPTRFIPPQVHPPQVHQTQVHPPQEPPQPVIPDKPPQPAPAVLSATPMLYVANPQLEIAAHQAAETSGSSIGALGMMGLGGGGDLNNLESEKKGGNVVRKPAPAPPISVVPSQVSSKKKEKKNRKLVRTAGGQTWEDPTLAEWDDDDFRLFCGDLGNDVTDEVLTRAFSKYASFVKAKVVRDKRTNKTKGFGFVSFKDPQDFIRATKEMNGRYVGSRPIKLRKSTWKNRSLDVVRKKEKEKAALIALLTGR